MSAHTPGPWSVGAPTGLVNQISIQPCIGVVYGAGDEIAANARLISAAPDMYEALKAARECILGRANIEYRKHGESTPLQDIYEELIAQIDAAMAKAGQ